MKDVKKCKYPNCNNHAEKTFALVPLCEKHFDSINRETSLFYKKGMKGQKFNAREDAIRREYAKIAYLISWSKERLGRLYEKRKKAS